jgi:DnaJ homolog subfamily A member 2
MIPKGIKEGTKITIEGVGNKIPNRSAGNLIVVIKTKKHEHFERRGADLYFEKKISFVDALVGINFTFKHLNENIIRVKSEENKVVKDGTKMTLMNYGMPFTNDGSKYGNMIITFHIEWPETIQPAQAHGLKNLFRTPGQSHQQAEETDATEVLTKFENAHLNEDHTEEFVPPSGSSNENNDGNNNNSPQCSQQ